MWPQVGAPTGCDDRANLADVQPKRHGPGAGCGTHVARAALATGLIHFAGGEIPGKNFGRDVRTPERIATILNRLALCVSPEGQSSATKTATPAPMTHVHDSANVGCAEDQCPRWLSRAAASKSNWPGQSRDKAKRHWSAGQREFGTSIHSQCVSVRCAGAGFGRRFRTSPLSHYAQKDSLNWY